MASISVALLLGLGLIASCGKPLPSGTFRGARKETGRPGADPIVLAQLNRVILKIGANGRADLEDGGIPWEGQVTRSGDQIDFTVAALNGINIERQASDLPRRLTFRVISEDVLDFGGVRLERSAER